MKMLGEYLEHASNLERLAAQEDDSVLKLQFEKQAEAYRKLAAQRAAQYRLPAASEPNENPKQ